MRKGLKSAGCQVEQRIVLVSWNLVPIIKNVHMSGGMMELYIAFTVVT